VADQSAMVNRRPEWIRVLQRASVVVALVIACIPLPLVDRAGSQEEATEIVVTTNSDVSNGDTSSVSALKTNPGSDGISLREAMEATNNDPGLHAIRFDPALAGSSVVLGSDLPPLLGGGVTIDGDVDNDGDPDLTLGGKGAQIGFSISSSANRLHGLELAGFMFGVVLQPPVNPIVTRTVFSDNTITGLVMRSIGKFGIGFDPTALGNCGVPCDSGNTWANTTVAGNTITAEAAGIFFWNSSSGERLEHVTVTDNQVTITGNGEGSGISLETAGPLGGEVSVEASISDAVISGNTVAGSPDIGINVAAGTGRSQDGVVDGIRVIDNQVELVKTGRYFCCQGIVVQAGSDSAEFAEGPPVRYLDDNVVRDVVVRGNTVVGDLEWGMSIQAGLGGGGRRNRVSDVRVIDNVFRTTKPALGAIVWTGDGSPYRNRYSAENRVRRVVFRSNSFMTGRGPSWRTAGGGAGAGGVVLMGGHNYGRENLIRSVRIVRSAIRTPYVGIRVIGGIGPTAKRNRVICIPRSANRIRGARKNIVIRSNVDGGFRNKARLSC